MLSLDESKELLDNIRLFMEFDDTYIKINNRKLYCTTTGIDYIESDGLVTWFYHNGRLKFDIKRVNSYQLALIYKFSDHTISQQKNAGDPRTLNVEQIDHAQYELREIYNIMCTLVNYNILAF